MIKYPGSFKRYLTKRELRLIFLLAICLVFCALYFLLAPKIDKLNSLKNQLSAVHKERSLYEKFYKERYDYDKIAAEYNDLIKKVPVNSDLSNFIVDIEQWAEHEGISLISIFPQNMIIENISETNVNIIPCEITICGDLDSLLTFLSKLEDYSRISKVDELQLTTPTENMLNYKFPWELTVKVILYYIPQLA